MSRLTIERLKKLQKIDTLITRLKRRIVLNKKGN